MKTALSARVTAEVCLLLLLYSMFAPAGLILWVPAVFAAVLFLCGLAAERTEGAVTRLLFCLPALVPLALAYTRPADMIAMAVCWVFAAIRFARGSREVVHWAYRREFYVLSAVAVVASLLIGGGAFHMNAPRPAILFGAAAILLGIYALRVIRLGAEDDLRWRAASAVDIVLPFGAAAGASSLLWLLCVAVYYVLKWLAGFIEHPEAPMIHSDSPDPRWHHIYSEVPNMVGNSGQVQVEDTPMPPVVPEPEKLDLIRRLPPYVWGIILLVLAALIAVLVVVLRRKRKAANKNEDPGDGEEMELSRAVRRKKGKTLSPDLRVRAAFREYLGFLQTRGQTIRESETSEDVLSAAGERGCGKEEEELRGLYIAARYGVRAAVTADDAARAEALVRAICGEA